MLEVRTVSKTYGSSPPSVALASVSATVASGDVAWITGPSGSGKSTLLGIMGLLVEPTQGEVLLDGRRIDNVSDAERTALRGSSIAFVPQHPRLFTDLSAWRNVSLARRGTGHRARSLQALEHVGLGDLGERPVGTLSGGQQQRVSMARAMVNEPVLVLADEPSSGLDDDSAATVFDILRRFARTGAAVVVASHDQRVADHVDQRIDLLRMAT
jgi:putative ABC transport system ATP-binding protein